MRIKCRITRSQLRIGPASPLPGRGTLSQKSADALAAGLGQIGRGRFPTRKVQENALGVLDGRYVPVVILDHLDRCTHLLAEKIDIDAFGKPKGGVCVAEAIGTPVPSPPLVPKLYGYGIGAASSR